MKLSLKKEWSGAVRNLSDWLLPDTLFSLLTWLKLSHFRQRSSTIGRDEAISLGVRMAVKRPKTMLKNI